MRRNFWVLCAKWTFKYGKCTIRSFVYLFISKLHEQVYPQLHVEPQHTAGKDESERYSVWRKDEGTHRQTKIASRHACHGTMTCQLNIATFAPGRCSHRSTEIGDTWRRF